MAGWMKSANWISATGRRPYAAAPMAAPTISDSVSGVSNTRMGPNSSISPSVTRKTPPRTPTSWPRTNTRSSRRISSASASWIASRNVLTATGPRSPSLREHVPHQIRRFGIRSRFRVGDGFVDIRRELPPQLLVVRLGQDAAGQGVLPQLAHRIVLLLALYFRRIPVLAVVVVAGVRREPVHLGLDKRGPFAAARPVHRFLHGAVDGENVRAVYGHAGEAVPLGPDGHVFHRHLLFTGNGNGVAVVFAEENDRQLVDAGKVHAFVHVAFVGRAFAVGGPDDDVVAPQLGRVRDARGVRHLCPHGAGAGENVEAAQAP